MCLAHNRCLILVVDGSAVISLIIPLSLILFLCLTLYTQSHYSFIKAHIIFVGEEALGASVIDSANHRMSVQTADHSGVVVSLHGHIYPGTLRIFQLLHVTFHQLSGNKESSFLLIFEPLREIQ